MCNNCYTKLQTGGHRPPLQARPGDGNVAALERSDNVADRGHAFAELKRGYPRPRPESGRKPEDTAGWKPAATPARPPVTGR